MYTAFTVLFIKIYSFGSVKHFETLDYNINLLPVMLYYWCTVSD